jgi:hypothetical protein
MLSCFILIQHFSSRVNDSPWNTSFPDTDASPHNIASIQGA